jgi:hypothetical protein
MESRTLASERTLVEQLCQTKDMEKLDCGRTISKPQRRAIIRPSTKIPTPASGRALLKQL